MSITRKPFGTALGGEAVTEYTLTNANGASVGILDFGGIVTKLCVPDRDGHLTDVALGYDDASAYATKTGSMGMLIGRYGNRIANAAFDLEGKTYVLDANDGKNSLHGGIVGFGQRMWQVEESLMGGDPALLLRLVSEDGDQGFPGKVEVQVTYALTKENELLIHYEAVTDAPTILNLTNHAYFNLEGHDAGTAQEHVLQINADFANEVDEGLIPTGKLVALKALPWSFQKPTRVGDVLSQINNDADLLLAGGVDFNYCAGRDRETKCIATLYAPKTGIRMDVITDQPGVQCYTANHLNTDGKGGVHYGRFSAVCLETQHYPDSIHHPQFPSVVLRPQDTYDTCTVYRFTVE